MRKQTRNKPTTFGRRRGRPPKALTVESMEDNEDPDIQFMGDLRRFDKTEVQGKDPKKHFRFVSGHKIEQAKKQGYVRTDSKDVISYYEGNVIPAEGTDARKANRELVLMEMPKSLYEKREALKEEKVDFHSQSVESRMRSSMAEAGASELPETDAFSRELYGGE